MRTDLSLFVLLLAAKTSVIGYPATEFYEGHDCPLEDGTTGTCKKLPECPFRVHEVRQGRRTFESRGRCGFQDFTEIVCCPLNISEKIGLRPAEVACREYDNEVSGNDSISAADLSFHIFGGTEAVNGEYPYIVALGYENRDYRGDDEASGEPIRYMCGGTLISSQHVLTAAHCVSNLDQNVPIEVRMGDTSLLSDAEDVQRIEISDIIKHPRYKRSVEYHDVAILRLKNPVRTSHYVKPICLQTKSLDNLRPSPDVSFVVIGWGATRFANEQSTNLMKTPSLSLVDTNACSRYYKGFRRLPRGLDETLVCALDTSTNGTNRADACHGDSGGPLLMISNTSHTVIGVTAFGQGCGGTTPGVYTSVYPYLDWIEQNVWPELNEHREESLGFQLELNFTPT